MDDSAPMVIDSGVVDKAALKTLSVKECSGQPHLRENSISKVADLSIWDKPLPMTDMIDYTSCKR